MPTKDRMLPVLAATRQSVCQARRKTHAVAGTLAVQGPRGRCGTTRFLIAWDIWDPDLVGVIYFFKS